MPRSAMLATQATWQPAWTPSKRRCFAASPIDTARPQENQRLETGHEGASKRAFRARLPPILTLCSSKIDVFLGVFLRTSKFATSKSMFRARFPSIFITSHKMPRLPRNLHLVATWRSTDIAIRKKTRNTTRLKCCACHAKWRWTRPKCTKTATHLAKMSQKYCVDTLQNTSECHEVPCLPRETKQHDVWNLQKWPLAQNLP